MPKTGSMKGIGDIVADLQKAGKMLDVQHIDVEGMPETPEVEIPFNKALSYIEAAKELVDQARKNLSVSMKASQPSKGKRK